MKILKGSENGIFSLLYELKMSLRGGVGGSKKSKTPLRNIKMVLYDIIEIGYNRNRPIRGSPVPRCAMCTYKGGLD